MQIKPNGKNSPMKKTKTYSVSIDMKWSEEYTVQATTAAEAKRIAWERFKKNPPKKLFELLADRENE